MSSTYTADTWERDKLSPSGGAATGNVEMGGQGGDSAQESKRFAHTAPAAKRGLVVSNGNKGGAVVAACQPSSFSGLYETVEFPVSTLFAPPHPPSELPPRVKRPARPGPVYANDIATAGELEHHAQREVSRMWRGVLCRRRLRQAQTLNEILNSRARRIQCWWRCLNARWRRRRLETIRDGWAKERMENYIAERMKNMKNILHWQWQRYEVAAQMIQQVVRWYLREKQRYRCAAEGLPESEWPPALEPYPFRRHRPYFPWRFALASKALSDRSGGVGEEATDSDAEQPTRTLLRFRPYKTPAEPPTQEEVEAANAKMWERNLERALALSTPEALSRAEWKTENLHHEDLDFNAGLVQRVFLSKKAFTTVRTKHLKEEYMKKVTRIIGRTFSMYVLVKRIKKQRAMRERQVRALMDKYNAQKIEHLEVEAVWQRELMDACATCIQRCWHWYRSTRRVTSPREDEASTSVPPRPPYGLINGQIKREQEIKWSSMNLMQRHEKHQEREHKYLRYVPKETLVYKKTGCFVS